MNQVLTIQKYLGGNGGKKFNSTEIISTRGSADGIELPTPYWNKGCAVNVNGLIYVIGGERGHTNPTNKFWIFDPSNGFRRSDGTTKMAYEREQHACGLMPDKR